MDRTKELLKVSDFGLSRLSNEEYLYVGENIAYALPMHHTAIECFDKRAKFSEKSDVWSFGVLCWELFARNLHPYKGLDRADFFRFLDKGRRLARVETCPEDI